MTTQFINDEKGDIQYVVIPYADYMTLLHSASQQGMFANIPDEVIAIMKERGVNLMTAWRLHRGFTQKEVAEQLAVSQSTVYKYETGARLHPKTIKKLAKVYSCNPNQLSSRPL